MHSKQILNFPRLDNTITNNNTTFSNNSNTRINNCPRNLNRLSNKTNQKFLSNVLKTKCWAPQRKNLMITGQKDINNSFQKEVLIVLLIFLGFLQILFIE